MKKISKFIFAFLLLTCVGVGMFFVITSITDKDTTQNSTEAQDNNVLSLVTQETINMVKGTQKTFYYVVNNNLAMVEIDVENELIAIIDSQNKLFALNCGSTVLTIKATYKTQTITKTAQIVVEEKQINFDELNSLAFTSYKSGVKANNSYESYFLKVTSNFDLSFSSMTLDDNIRIVNTTFLNDNKTLIIEYNLLAEGEFEFIIEGFSFSRTATNYISSLALNFENVQIADNKITLYDLQNVKASAYQDGKYDYAELTQLNLFEVIVENTNVVNYNNLIFTAQSAGQTNVVFKALDGSGFEYNLVVVVEEIFATNCQINLQSISLFVGENFDVELTNFVPSYASVKNVTITASENLAVNGYNVCAISAGEGFVNIFLNGNQIYQIQVTVNVLPTQKVNYTLAFDVVPAGACVDMENMTIRLPLGLVQLRVYIFDEQNNLASVSVEILTGSSSVSIDGNVMSINFLSSSVLRIINNENNQYYDFYLVSNE